MTLPLYVSHERSTGSVESPRIMATVFYFQHSLIQSIASTAGVLITSYTSIVKHKELLLPYEWHYIVLDEGHKIRNPDTQATLVCKQVRTIFIIS